MLDVDQQEALLEAEARYRSLLAEMDDGYALLQLLFDDEDRPIDYRFLEANAQFAEHTGLQGAIGRTARELVPNLDAFWFERYGRVALTGEKARFEQHAPAMDRWFEVTAIRVGSPELRQVALLFRNITERKKAEAERERLLREVERARNRLQNLFENAPAFVASLTGPEHVFEMANPPYRQLVGSGRRLRGRRVIDAIPEVVAQGFIELLDRVYATGEPFVGHETHLKIDRTGEGKLEDVWVTFVYQARRDVQGEIDGIDAFGFEVTTEVQGRKQAEALAERLRESTVFEQQLLGIVSHDLRNPIHAITLSTSTLLSRPDLDARQQRALDRIRHSAERARRMIRDLLDFTQARSGGGLLIHRTERDLHAVARQVVDEVQVIQPDREISLEQTDGGEGFFDADRIAQVLGNLLSNALQYSAPASPVTVKTWGEAKSLGFSVHNCGTPIPPDILPQLFQPMQRGTASPDASSRSVGLGLYIVERVVKAHGGEIKVRSTAEEGTTFTVCLPRKVPEGH